MAQRLVDLLKNQFALAVLETHAQHGDETVVLDPGSWHEVCRFLRDSPAAQMNMLMDLTAVDYPDRDPRFEVVAHLYSLQHGYRLRLKARVGDQTGEDASVASLTDLWGSANWMERECRDMFGIKFVGHPDLRRILTDYGFIGHPFRKDFPLIGNVEVRYDPEKKRVIYQPVTINPRTLVPRVIREDHRYDLDEG